MELQITKMNIEENNQKYLIMKKITDIFMSIIVSLLILLFLYLMSKNSYAFLYIIFFFIMCGDIVSVYNSSSSGIINEKEIENEIEIENKDVKKKDDQLQQLLKKIKKMNKKINKSKMEIENLKKKIHQTHSLDDSQNDEETTVVSSTPSSPFTVISSSDLEKLIDESIKQFESDDMIIVDNANVD